MIKALGFSRTLFDPASPGRLCRGRERWIEGYPIEGNPQLHRLVVSGAAFSDDTARDAQRGLAHSGVTPGQALEALFPFQTLLAFCEQGQPALVPEEPVRAEAFVQPRFGGRRFDRCVRWRVVVSGAASIDELAGLTNPSADGFLPWSGELTPALEEALYLLVGHGERLGFPKRRYLAAALPELFTLVPWVALVHLDKHATALGIYSVEPIMADEVLSDLARLCGVLPVPFSIPPMLARWDRALYELRQDWPDGEFPVPPGEHRPPEYERRKPRPKPEE